MVFCRPQFFGPVVSGSFDHRVVRLLSDDLVVDLWTRRSAVAGLSTSKSSLEVAWTGFVATST